MTIVRTRTPAGEAIVILPEAEFEHLRELAEDTLDARALDASQARLDAGGDEVLSEADLDALRAAATPLAFWRARRGQSLDALAQAGAVAGEVIAAMERGDVTGEPAVYARLARALDLDVEDLLPAA